MDVNVINSFVEAMATVMPQLGFQKVEKAGLELRDNLITNSGVMAQVGIMGQVKGNIIYNIESDTAKKIASTMMMGMPVAEFDEMAQSAISELANMLCANASIKLSGLGLSTDISPPTLLFGREVSLKVSVNKVVVVKMLIDDLPINIDIAIE
jgi:chemotaxis protein CheX